MVGKKLWLGIPAAALVFVLVLAGCASTPTEFETAGSLAGTQWGKFASSGGDEADLAEFNDETTGVYSDSSGTELPFTYTASYDEKKRNFIGSLTFENGTKRGFTAKKEGIFGWSLYYDDAKNTNRPFMAPGQPAMWKDMAAKNKAFAEQYGPAYEIPELKGGMAQMDLKHNSGTKAITAAGKKWFAPHPYDAKNPGNTSAMASYASATPYILHSHDGKLITLELVDTRVVKSGEYKPVAAGSFKLSVEKKNVSGKATAILTIFEGKGQGEQFNGVWTYE